MKQLIGNKFLLNGTVERVLHAPDNREGNVIITMGGMVNHKAEISLHEFEKTTGFCLKNLEPVSTRKDADVIAQYMSDLRDMDMTIATNHPRAYVIKSNIEFTTKSNSKMRSELNAIMQADVGYLASVSKTNQYGARTSKIITGTNLEVVLETAVGILRDYISTKVQVTSKTIDNDESNRRVSEQGIAYLFENESIESYFNKQSRPAGVAINNKGRFQIFSSYEAANGERRFHYQTKDYATLKNAEKALEVIGYSVDGKCLDVKTDEQLREFESEARKCMRHDSPHWRPMASMAEFDMNHGRFEISEIYKEIDPQDGVVLKYNMLYQDDATGKRVEVKNNIIHIDTEPYAFSRKIQSFIKAVSQDIESGNLAYDEDMRTLDEVIAHHKDRFLEHTRRFKTLKTNYDNVIKSNSYSAEWQVNVKQRMDAATQSISFHKAALERLGKEVDKVEKSHGLSHNEPSL